MAYRLDHSSTTHIRCLFAVLLLVGSAAVASEEPTFVIEDSMLHMAWHEDGVLGLNLDEAAASEFEAFSAAHVGEIVLVLWNDLELPRFTIHDVIDGGRFRVPDPNDALVKAFEGFEAQRLDEKD